MITNNILSYFIKDIKSAKERAFYQQTNYNNNVRIYYKDKLIYDNYKGSSSNYRTNIRKLRYLNRIINHKIDSNKLQKTNVLYYKKDKMISDDKYITSCIYYNYEYIKYLIKTYIGYTIDKETILWLTIKYYNGYKYFFKSCTNFKYKRVLILIMNKYELYYINRFFNLL
jgi:hypothetical protein